MHLQLVLAVLGGLDLAPLVQQHGDGRDALNVDVDAIEVPDVQVLQVLAEVHHRVRYHLLVAVNDF